MYNDKSMSGHLLYQYRTPNTTRSANSWRGTVADEEGAGVYVMVFVNATTCRMASMPPPRRHSRASAIHLKAGLAAQLSTLFFAPTFMSDKLLYG